MMDKLCLFLSIFVALSHADTPGNCMFEDIAGTWTFKETERSMTPIVDQDYCDSIEESNTVSEKNFTLTFPNIATDEIGNIGTWTMIYNQGFEVSNSLIVYNNNAIMLILYTLFIVYILIFVI